MNIDELVFFNKEGYAMNLNRNPDFGYYYGSMYFDRNSTDTFKTLGIYLFEKTLPSNNTFQAYLDKFQSFNTDGFNFWSKFSATSLQITDIQKTNNNSSFFTKWIYADSIEQYYSPGQWIYFSGLDSYQSTNFASKIGFNQQLFQILSVQTGRVMVKTAQNNSVSLSTFVPSSLKTITPVNVIEQDIDLTSIPTWQESSGMSKIYLGKKLSLLTGSQNDGVYTSNGPSVTKQKSLSTFTVPVYTPTAGDFLRFVINFFTDRILVANGVTVFSTTNIHLPYVPQSLKVGDQIVAQAKSVALTGSNSSTFTVTSIDSINNLVSVTPSPTAQTVDCYVYLATNQLVIDQTIVLDNNNVLSIPVTYWSVTNNWKNSLQGYDIDLEYLTASDSLQFRHSYGESYFTVTMEVHSSNGAIVGSPISPTLTNLTAYPYWVQEDLQTEESLPGDSTIYLRDFVFSSIDDQGIRLNINGQNYFVDYDISVANTTSDWISQFSSGLALIGIGATLQTTNTSNDTIRIVSDFPNRPVTISASMGDFSVWNIPLYSYNFVNIKTQLLITVDGTGYPIPFSTSDSVTVTNWFNAYQARLSLLGTYVSNPLSGTLVFAVRDPEKKLVITHNIGYVPKSGDDAVTITNLATEASGGVMSGNEIKVVTGTYDFLQYYATGQKIGIQGALKLPQNASYNVIGLQQDTISLSYQGAFWQQGTPVFVLTVASDFFIQSPRAGIQSTDRQSVLRWSWKDTQNDDIFLYDFSGNQLAPVNAGFPQYAGPLPLCGPDASIEVKLNKFPNGNSEWIYDPTKQQTVFDQIVNKLEFSDGTTDISTEPEPIQVFIGYNSSVENYTKSRLYCELVEDVSFTLQTASNFMDNLWVFSSSDSSLSVTSPLTNFDFLQLGFTAGQTIEISSVDCSTDNRKISTMLNHGKKLLIKSVQHNRITFVQSVLDETSVKTVNVTVPPFYDSFGNAITEHRRMQVTLNVLPQLVAYFDIYGESEEEDERHRINLDNRNLNILKLQDFFIFKEVGINEKGIDWIVMNRKRKQLLEIYPEIFNYVSSYKAIIQAINFFGYNDLTFTEYFQNLDPDSKKFGQLFNMELLGLFDKSVKGASYSNLAIENLRNIGYRKTNLFSLNYKITDSDGNFINGYSLDEVQVKLMGLKRWLTQNLVPIGAKITDINGEYTMPVQWHIQHDTYRTKRFNVEEYSAPIDFYVDGYLMPVTTGSDQYSISVKPFSALPIVWFDIIVRTFYLDVWQSTDPYSLGDDIYWLGFVWKANQNVSIGEEPGSSVFWDRTDITSIPSNQVIRDFRYNDQPLSFTINSMVDPHFVVEINWSSGYACTLTTKKAYSVIPGFFDDLKM